MMDDWMFLEAAYRQEELRALRQGGATPHWVGRRFRAAVLAEKSIRARRWLKHRGRAPTPGGIIVAPRTDVNAMCDYSAVTRSSKARGESPSCWQSRTAMVWLSILRSQRESRCHSSRAQTFFA